MTLIPDAIGDLLLSPAFCPYHMGHFSVAGLGLEDYVSAEPHVLLEAPSHHVTSCRVCWQMKASHFAGLLTTALGYVLLAGALITCHVSLDTLLCVRSRETALLFALNRTLCRLWRRSAGSSAPGASWASATLLSR